MNILIINGPNLNLIGQRHPAIYGNRSFEEFLEQLNQQFSEQHLDYFQSNHMGKLIDQLQKASIEYDAVILNGGGYSHTSVALADAVADMEIPVIEVHISNIYAREEFRHRSMLSAYCKGCIVGLGLEGYRLAIHYLLQTNV